jgi:hypothetical protein
MPKLQRWLVVSKKVPIIDNHTMRDLMADGVHIGGGWSEVHQHILVNARNKERIEQLLASRGYTVQSACKKEFFHPEQGQEAFMRDLHHTEIHN